MSSLFCCLQLFASWIRDGVYDFATLPFGVKTNLSSQDLQLIQKVPHEWTGREGGKGAAGLDRLQRITISIPMQGAMVICWRKSSR